MQVSTDLFGAVIPAELNSATQVELASGDGSQTAPAVITLRIDEALDFLVADYLCLTTEKHGLKEAAELFRDAFNDNGSIEIRFDAGDQVRSVMSSVLSYSTPLLQGLRDQVKGKIFVHQSQIGDDSEQLDYAKLCIPNFPEFTGANASTEIETRYSHQPDRVSWHRMGYVELQADDWRVHIAQRTESSEPAYSHDVGIYKVNSAPFTGTELAEFINNLSFFLTFVSGTPRRPSMSVGYQNLNPVWGQFNRFKQNPYVEDNWFNPRVGGSIATLFPLFWQQLSTNASVLTKPIELYAESSEIARSGLHQHALTVSQSALENIAESKIGKMPRGTSAADHINHALNQIGIDTNLSNFPAILAAWTTRFKGSPSDGGPTFVARLRNSVHPRPTNTMTEDLDYYNAWRLSQYYVETALLKICNYTDKYRNRMTSEWTTDSEIVPWAPKQNTL